MIVEEARFLSQAEPTPSPAVLRTGRSVLPVAAQGIGDSDAQVRRLCLEAFRQTALALKKQIPEVRLEVYSFFPAEGLNVTPQAIAKIHGALRPMVQVMRDQLPKITPALGDADVTVFLAANQALEAIGGVRQRLLGLTAPATRFGLGEAKPGPSEDLLGQGLESMVPSLAALSPHKDIRIRLAVLYVLETLETRAAPAVKGVLQALGDRD